MDDACEISLILPAFNEAAGIAQAIVEADDALARLGKSYEIIVVDDGSSDATATIVAQLLRCQRRVRLLRHGANRGYGAALRTGFAAARGTRIAFTDADCQFFIDDLALLLPQTETHPIVVGYRIDRQDSWLRKVYSRGYNLLTRVLLGASVRDIDCALKVFRRDALEKIVPETGGFFVNTEMLAKARQHHVKIAEVGVRHRPRQRGASKVSLADIPRVLNALLPFWWMQVMFPADVGRIFNPAGAEAGLQNRPTSTLRWSLTILLFAMACILFFAGLDHPLLEPEEARYAEIPRQMLDEGRLLTPVLHGEDYWQKPPLLYWLVMLSYRIFGVYDWAARLVPCLAGIFCVGITTAWGWRTLGFWPGFVSGAILTLSVRFLYLAGMLTMDGPLCAFVLAGLATGHLALTEGNQRTRWSLLCTLACALGILTKGPVALVLIVVPLLALAFLDRRCRFWTARESLTYLGLIALAAGPWFVVMALRAPEAAGSFVWLHNFMRYVAPLDHEKPAWFYLPSLLLGMLPWTLLLLPALPYLWRKSLRAGRRRPAPLGMFVLAFLWCVLFFSLSGCKRPGYILPALPLLALILGTFVTHGLPWRQWVQDVTDGCVVTGNEPRPSGSGRRRAGSLTVAAREIGHRWGRRLTVVTCGMGMTCSLAAALAQLWPWLDAAFLASVFALVGVLILATPLRRLPAWTSWTNCVVVVFFLLFVAQRAFLPDYHDRFGLRRQVEIMSEYEQEEDLPILTYPKRWDSVSFYRRDSASKSYTAGEIEQMIRDLQTHGKALVLVHRDGALDTLRSRLPAGMEIELLGKEADYIAVGLVRRK